MHVGSKSQMTMQWSARKLSRKYTTLEIEYLSKLNTREQEEDEIIEEEEEEVGRGFARSEQEMEEDSKEETIVPSKCDKGMPSFKEEVGVGVK